MAIKNKTKHFHNDKNTVIRLLLTSQTFVKNNYEDKHHLTNIHVCNNSQKTQKHLLSIRHIGFI